MLRTLRILAAVLCFALITLLFLDFSGTLHPWFGWLPRIQFLPALLAVNIGVVAFLILGTLLFGRIYCSVLCPLGVFQDLVSWIAGRRRKNRFSYSPALNGLRFGVLAFFGVAVIAGVGSLVALLDPYGAYGRIASALLGPVYQWSNNLLAHLAEGMNSYAVYGVDVWLRSAGMLAMTTAMFAVLAVLAWRNGRTYCNAVCPVGSILGTVSRFSLFGIRIDSEKCNACGLCAKNCKASCIDHKTAEIDRSRCVSCMNCTAKCRRGAIRYTLKRRRRIASENRRISDTVSSSRRSFLWLGALSAVSAVAGAKERKVDGGLALIGSKRAPTRTTHLVPPGARSIQSFTQHCTACQLCVSVCPNQVLRPSRSLDTLMQPEMSYERGFCRPECTECSEVCPAGAVHPVTRAEKSAIQIGHAVWNSASCIINTRDVGCGNCARHCPAGAIHMAPQDPENPKSAKFPMVDIERCIGCGACEYVCPARPCSAIQVEGHERHRIV